MNYEEAKKKAKVDYGQSLKDIELCNEVAKKIEPFLPKDWKCRIELVCFNLHIEKGDWGTLEEADAIEFKTVCKIAEKIIGEKLDRKAEILDEKIQYLEAEKYFHGKNKGWICVNITLFNPKNMPDCKITPKRTWKTTYQVSDECLGLS